MTNPTIPPATDLPTVRQLNRATLLAAGGAIVLLVTAVLPAEYGIDPTGIGSALGLTPMGQTKQAAAGRTVAVETQPGANAQPGAPTTTVLPDGSTEIRLALRPFEGREAKAMMKAGGTMTWRWTTDGEKLDYEFHGDRPGATEGDYTSYEKGTAASASGTFRATFDGRHGWYWKNNSSKPVVLTATVKGDIATFALLD